MPMDWRESLQKARVPAPSAKHPAPPLQPDQGGGGRRSGSGWRSSYRIDAGIDDRQPRRDRSRRLFDRSHFNASEFHVRAGFGKLDGLVVAVGFKDEESAHHFLGFRKGTVDHGGFPVQFPKDVAFAVFELIACNNPALKRR